MEAGLDPTIQVGGYLKQINGNYKVGNSDIFIIEACEYVESFLKFSLKSEIILNIDNDHLDYFENFDNIKNAFIKYVKLLPEDGILVLNADDAHCLSLKDHTKAKTLTYSLNDISADYIAKNITFDENGYAAFDVYFHNDFFETIRLSVPGLHNVSNSLSCIALSNEYHISKEAIKNALGKFEGTHRRFELIGKFDDVTIYDDYGHHPTEIHATYEALKRKNYHESWVVFQPHTYNRTKALLEEFAFSLKDFDHIIITDIYTARGGKETYVSSQDLVDKIYAYGKSALYIEDFKDIKEYIRKNAKTHDIVLTIGAGSIGDLGKMIVEI